jgi:hypothetical protein
LAGRAIAQPRYSRGVLAAGRQVVDDLRLPGATGPQAKPDKTPTANARLLAATGAQVDPATRNIYVTRSASFQQWDFTGWSVLVDGDGVEVEFSNSRFGRRDGGVLLVQSWNVPGSRPKVTVRRCEFDHGTPPARNRNNSVSCANGSLSVELSYFHDCPSTFIAMGSPETLTVKRCFFRAMGKNAFANPARPAENTHSDNIIIRNGVSLISECLMDGSDGVGIVPDGVLTGMLLAQAGVGPTRLILERSVLCGLSRLPLFYALQLDDSTHGLTVELRDNVIERPSYRGSGNYLTNNTARLIASGNRDYETGASIL